MAGYPEISYTYILTTHRKAMAVKTCGACGLHNNAIKCPRCGEYEDNQEVVSAKHRVSDIRIRQNIPRYTLGQTLPQETPAPRPSRVRSSL